MGKALRTARVFIYKTTKRAAFLFRTRISAVLLSKWSSLQCLSPLKCLMSAWSHSSVTSGCLCCHKHFSKICLGRESFLMTKLNAYHLYL
jgi:hypothetical protein